MSRRRFQIGVDAGGTSVRLCVYDPDRRIVVLKTKLERGLNLSSTSEDEQRAVLQDVRKLLSEEIDTFDGLVLKFAASGASDRLRRERLERLVLETFPGCEVSIESDVDATFRVCTGGENALLVICGTGSVILGPGGRRAGGWGHLFGDEAGAFSIVVSLMRELFNYVDGVGTFDPIFEQIFEFFQASSPQELTNLQSAPNFKSRIAKLAKVLKVTPLVAKIFDEQLSLLTSKVRVLAETLGLKKAYTHGGMFENELFDKIFRRKLEDFEIKKCDVEVHVALSMEVGDTPMGQ